MKHRRSRRTAGTTGVAPRLQITSMVDVVFLLLVFFVMTIRPEDVIAHLDVSRGGAGQDIPLVHIFIERDALTLNGKRVDPAEMDRVLMRLGGLSRTRSVVITCAADSSHAALITVLDLCAKAGLEKVALTSR